MENTEKPSFLSKTGPQTKFVRENFCFRKLPFTCRIRILTFLKTGFLTENPDSGVREKSETWNSYFLIVLHVYIWCIMENIGKPSFLSKTGPRTKFVRENFCTRKLPITCRFQICTFWKTGLPDKKPEFRDPGHKNWHNSCLDGTE